MSVAFHPTAAGAASADSLIVGESQAIVELRRLVRQVAPSPASVIVTGPSGRGKEMVARAITAERQRASTNYVAVNCGTSTRDLPASETYGHQKATLTGHNG